MAASVRLRRLLAGNDFPGIEALFRGFFAGIPCEWHTRNEIARYEGYYASVFYSHFAAAGLPVVVKDSGSRGRVESYGRKWVTERRGWRIVGVC